MDVIDVTRATRRALEHIRVRGGPVFVEYRTYRFRAHSMFDPDLYRSRHEVEEWKHRDPIRILADRLLAEHVLTSDDVDGLWTAAREETEAAVRAADAAAFEGLDTLERHVLLEREAVG